MAQPIETDSHDDGQSYDNFEDVKECLHRLSTFLLCKTYEYLLWNCESAKAGDSHRGQDSDLRKRTP